MATSRRATRLLGGLEAAASVGRAVGVVGLDAARDAIGAALPRTPSALARPEVISAILGENAVSARLTGVEFPSSNCQNFLVEVTTGAGTRSIYAKLPARNLAPRVFANAVGYWALECEFCLRVAPHVPVRVPRVLGVARRGSRFVLLLENVAEIPGARLFVNRDMAKGTTPERATTCLATFAKLHAGFHGWEEGRRNALLPLALHPHLGRRQRAMSKALHATAIGGARRKAGDLFLDEHAALCRQAVRRWDDLIDYWYREPLTLVHGDSHLGNCFEYETPTGTAIGLLDFQGVHWSKGIRDVAYFLIHSLEPDVLARHEESLLASYVTDVRALGVTVDDADVWEQYRAFAFQALSVGLIAVGLGGFTENDDTVRTMLRRELAAVDRLRFAEWLGSLESPRSA